MMFPIASIMSDIDKNINGRLPLVLSSGITIMKYIINPPPTSDSEDMKNDKMT